MKTRSYFSWKKTYWQWYRCKTLNRNRNKSAVRTQLELKAFQCAFLYLWIVFIELIIGNVWLLQRFYVFRIEMMFLSCLTRIPWGLFGKPKFINVAIKCTFGSGVMCVWVLELFTWLFINSFNIPDRIHLVNGTFFYGYIVSSKLAYEHVIIKFCVRVRVASSACKYSMHKWAVMYIQLIIKFPSYN